MNYYRPTRAFIRYMRTIRGASYKVAKDVTAIGINWTAPKRFKTISVLALFLALVITGLAIPSGQRFAVPDGPTPLPSPTPETRCDPIVQKTTGICVINGPSPVFDLRAPGYVDPRATPSPTPTTMTPCPGGRSFCLPQVTADPRATPTPKPCPYACICDSTGKILACQLNLKKVDR